jgi:hypothetical protein
MYFWSPVVWSFESHIVNPQPLYREVFLAHKCVYELRYMISHSEMGVTHSGLDFRVVDATAKVLCLSRSRTLTLSLSLPSVDHAVFRFYLPRSAR